MNPELVTFLTSLAVQGVRVKTTEMENDQTRIRIKRDDLNKKQRKRIQELIKKYAITTNYS